MTVLDTTVAPALSVLELIEPLPGFPRYREYAFVPAGEGGLAFWLQALDAEGPRFLVVPAAPYFPDYAPDLPAAVRAELGLAVDAEPELYCVVTVPAGDVGSATANLCAPLAVNPATSAARQVVLADGRHPIRRPLRR